IHVSLKMHSTGTRAHTAAYLLITELPYPQRFGVALLPVLVSLIEHVHKGNSRLVLLYTISFCDKFILGRVDDLIRPVQGAGGIVHDEIHLGKKSLNGALAHPPRNGLDRKILLREFKVSYYLRPHFVYRSPFPISFNGTAR